MRIDDALAGWLLLREAPDAAARSAAVTRALVDALAGLDPLRVLDLGSGTGANVRYLAPHLPPRQQWLVADRDPALLALQPARTASWAAAQGFTFESRPDGCAIHRGQLTCGVQTRTVDLGSVDNGALFAGRHLVTASALLDLTSERWLTGLAHQCRAAGAAVLFALTYNGLSTCSPAEPEDETVRDLLNRHQRTDKGLGGPAAGPAAADLAVRCFVDAGYVVHTGRSDWMLGPPERELQHALVTGWANAAMELMPAAAGRIACWRRRRHEHIRAGRSGIVVGHIDMAAWLPR